MTGEKLFGNDVPQAMAGPRPDDATVLRLLLGALVVLPGTSIEDRRFWLAALKRIEPALPDPGEDAALDRDLRMAVDALRYWGDRPGRFPAPQYASAHFELGRELRSGLKRTAGDLVRRLEADGRLDPATRVGPAAGRAA